MKFVTLGDLPQLNHTQSMASPNPQPSSASLIDGDNALFDIEHGDREDDEVRLEGALGPICVPKESS